MRLVAISAAVFASALTLSMYSPSSAHAAPQNDQKETKRVTIEHGDTLSKIAKEEKTTYLRLFYANTKIKHPDLIYPGDKVRVPSADEKLKKRPLPAAVSAPASAPQPALAPAAAPAATPPPQRTSSYSAPAQTSSPVSGGVWDRLAACESGGNWAINTGNGYYGGVQFSLSSWQAVGGSGLPSNASKAEQIMRAERLLAMQGWGAWPACSAKLGLR